MKMQIKIIIKMVKETLFKNKKAYMCKECGWIYLKKEIAEKCEQYCKKYKACNLEFKKHAINIQ